MFFAEQTAQAQRETAIAFKKGPDMLEPLSRNALAHVEKREVAQIDDTIQDLLGQAKVFVGKPSL